MEALIRRIRREGPVPFSAFMDEALYGSVGFYTRGGGAGRMRDFITSPELGGLFGSVLAGALDAWWREMGSPDPFLVAECGAGPGALAQSILAATPACGPALRYLLIDRAEPMRRAQRVRGLPMSEPAMVLGGFGGSVATSDDGESDEPAPALGQGPLCTSLGELPELRVHVVLANELLDNLAADVCQRADNEWLEVRVGLGDADDFLEVLVPAAPELDSLATRLAPAAETGSRIPVQAAAGLWLRSALDRTVAGGRIVGIDYARSTSAMATLPWQQWLRTYRGHGRGGHPLLDPGTTDITVDVALDQLALVRRPTADQSQADFLRAHGIDGMAADATATWRERADIGDLPALRARSRAHEAKSLCDPEGLGGFRVLEWIGR